jgi:RNA polymerase sigma factor (sigma-70 family)
MMAKATMNVWSRLNEPDVVQEMRNHPNSPCWVLCYELIPLLVRKAMLRAHLPSSDEEDIVQLVMEAVVRGLPGFREEGCFTVWLTRIVANKVVDVQRHHIRRDSPCDSLEQLKDTESETGYFDIPATRTTESECLMRERLWEAIAKLHTFLTLHRKAERNTEILQSVLLDDRTCAEVARELGIECQVVRQVVFMARHYLQDLNEDLK